MNSSYNQYAAAISGLNPTLDSDPAAGIGGVISAGVGVMTVVAGVYFLFNILTGAITVISSSGDKGALEQGRNRITYGFIGLAIAIAAIFIIGVVATILNVPTILDINSIFGGAATTTP